MTHLIARMAACAAVIGACIATPALAQQSGAQPSFGSVTLEAGFLPDPHRKQITAGGSIDAARTRGGNCVGMIASAPDYNLVYTAGSSPLVIKVGSQEDTTLVINAADGRWYCNDDSDGVQPGIRISNPPSGVYEIWVGTYGEAATPATIYITEPG